MDFNQDFLTVILSTLSVLTTKGTSMTITIGNFDFFQLLAVIGGTTVVVCGFLWWLIVTVRDGTKGWQSVKSTIENLSNSVNAIETRGEMHGEEIMLIKTKIQALEIELAYIKNNFIERLEMLEIFKRIELFTANLVSEFQKIMGRPIDVQPPDLQTPILKRHQDLADQDAMRRNRN